MADLNPKTKILLRPVVTEKATDLAMAKYPVYAFFVSATATKPEVAKAIKAKYKVEPIKVAIINNRRKIVSNRLKPGVTARSKKALVYLPAGTTLSLA